MAKKIYITRKLPSVALELLLSHFEVDKNLQNRPLDHEELIEVVKNYDGILTTFVDVINRSVLEHAGPLKAISNFAIGLDNIDLAYAGKRGIAVYNVPDIVTNSTADLTLALFLALVRKIACAHDYVREGHWVQWNPDLFMGEELHGKNFGIIGFGRIGRAVAKRVLGFGLKPLIFHHTKISKDELSLFSAEQLDWNEFLENIDYLSIHVPLTEKTRFMIDVQAFDKMKKRPLLINTARGAIVHPDDLTKALKEGLVRGAALDVTYPEPLNHSHPLCHLDNCLIVPHIGSATVECRQAMAKKAAENLINHFIVEIYRS